MAQGRVLGALCGNMHMYNETVPGDSNKPVKTFRNGQETRPVEIDVLIDNRGRLFDRLRALWR
jgi:hypothetical protein